MFYLRYLSVTEWNNYSLIQNKWKRRKWYSNWRARKRFSSVFLVLSLFRVAWCPGLVPYQILHLKICSTNKLLNTLVTWAASRRIVCQEDHWAAGREGRIMSLEFERCWEAAQASFPAWRLSCKHQLSQGFCLHLQRFDISINNRIPRLGRFSTFLPGESWTHPHSLPLTTLYQLGRFKKKNFNQVKK